MKLRQKNYDEETVYKFYTQFRFSNICIWQSMWDDC